MAEITLKELAERMQVSPATVSMVLHGRPGVSQETRGRVSEALRAAGYEIKVKKRKLTSPLSPAEFLIGGMNSALVAANPFFTYLVDCVEREAEASGFDVTTRYLNAGDDHVLSESGCILFATMMNKTSIDALLGKRALAVVLDNEASYPDRDTVVIDNAGGIESAVGYLLEKGSRRIGFLSSGMKLDNFQKRKTAFLDSMAHFGMPVDPADVLTLGENPGEIAKSFDAYLKATATLPDAFLTEHDLLALEVADYLKGRAIMPGKDIDLVGFDDIAYARMLDPPLTTVHVYAEQFAKAAVAQLRERMEDPSAPAQKRIISTKLVTRKSA